MKAWLLGGALLASMLAYAGDSKDQWGKDNPYNAKLPEPVSTMAVSGVNRARMATLGATIRTEGPDAFRRQLAAETETWGAIVRARGIRLD